MWKYAVAVWISMALAALAFAITHKDTCLNACSEVWAAVKDTLGDAVNYHVKRRDDATMSAFCQPKHSVPVTVSGALLQRTNSVILHAKGSGCEMQVKSNYSGFEHNDSGDFKKRVDESLARLKGPAPAGPVKMPDEEK